MSDPLPYNPLDKLNLGKSVAEALLHQPKAFLGELEPFSGAGIYVIYYGGDFKAYHQLTELNTKYEIEIPIYVGKADLEGGRKGLVSSDIQSSSKLYKRLAEHAKSIKQAQNLNIDDFTCRYLVVDEIWISLGETLLIAKFAPLWNQLVEGFGNHDPGKGRRAGMRSRWDVLHPGRKWVEYTAPRPDTSEEIIGDINEHLRSSVVIQRLLAGRFPNGPRDIDGTEL